MRIEWRFFKNAVDSRKLRVQYVEDVKSYYVWALIGSFAIECELERKSKDGTDFENNYKSKANLQAELLSRLSNVTVDDKMRVRHIGAFNDTITACSEQDIDWTIPQMQYNQQDVPSIMVGIKYLSGANKGDQIDFRIVDIDGVGVCLGLYTQAFFDCYGPITLDQFADKYYLDPNGEMIREHKADLIPGLFVRGHYYNNHTSNQAEFIANILRYIDTSEV